MNAYRQAEIIAEVRNKILSFYVDDVDSDKLLRGALDGMVSALEDPYASYLNAEDYKKITEGTEGQFIGIGIEIAIKNNFLTVVSPIEGSPASRVGILVDDKILEINGDSTEGITIEGAIEKLRGKVGTKVELRIMHRDSNQSVILEITRGRIELKSIKDPHIVDNQYNIGYVRLTRFNKNTYKDLKKHIALLQQQGMKHLILDMRFNPGGLLTASVEVVNAFISDGVVVTTKGRLATTHQTYTATKNKLCWDGPLAVIINGSSASASEIVAGALQDYHRAIIVGSRSYGKGSVQSIISLRDEKRALKITTAKYYTPSGRSIQKTSTNKGGVVPDEIISFSTKKQGELIRSFSEKDYVFNDEQLKKAIEIIKTKASKGSEKK